VAGFHFALPDEPVRLLVGWLLVQEEADLGLRHGGQDVERFHGALQRSPGGGLSRSPSRASAC
jgi:hypothetical protein